MDEVQQKLNEALKELEITYGWMKIEYGEQVHLIKDTNGQYLTVPVLTALVNGYAALRKNR